MFFGGIFWFILIFLFLGALVLAGVALAGRREDDPDHRRPYAMYVLAVVFLSLVVLVTAGGTVASNVAHVIVDDEASGSIDDCFSSLDADACIEFGSTGSGSDNARWAEVIRALITALVTALVLRVHWALKEPIATEAGVAQRTYGNYLYLTCFVALVVALSALVAALYSLVQIAIPGTIAVGSDDAERDHGIIDLITNLVVGGSSGWIFRYHWERALAFRAQLQGGAG